MKYNKIIRNFALMVVASSTLIACDDFLDREPHRSGIFLFQYLYLLSSLFPSIFLQFVD